MKLAGFAVIACLAWIGAPAPGAVAAAAQDYPTRPIRLIVPFPAGAGIDIIGRTVGQALTGAWKQSVVVDNRPGAGGTLGSDIVARATSDGYTLLVANTSTLAVAPSLYKKLPYVPLRDFAPITLMTVADSVLLIPLALPATSVKELIALARARPGQLNYGSAGTGTTTHMSGELFRSMAGVDIVHVPYKGTAQAYIDMQAGRLQLMIVNIASALPHIRAGRLRPLATTALKRSGTLPELPTVSEAGVPGFEVSIWSGIVAPARTPAPVILRLHGDIVRILRSAEMKGHLAAQGLEVVGNKPAEFAAAIKAETEKWAKIVRASGAAVE